MKIRYLFAASTVPMLSLLSACTLPTFFSTSSRIQRANKAYEGPRLVWISLDGLRHSDVEKYLAMTKKPHAKGFKALFEHGQWNTELKVTNPTITASSHISTITCTPPGVHGIIANKQWNGTTMVSGFKAPYKGETFAASLKHQGLNVVSIGYVGLDDGNEAHTPSEGVGYDDVPVTNKPVYREIAIGATDSFDVPSRLVENTFQHVTVSNENDILKFGLPSGEVVSAGLNEWANLNFSHDGKKEQVPVYVYEVSSKLAKYYVSPVGINKASPDAFRKKLDDANIIFSNAKDYSMVKVSDSLYTTGLAHRTDFFKKAAIFALENEKPDALFVYFEDLDTLGHQYSGDATKEEIRALHFAKLDSALGSILERLPASTNVLLMGDHGMSTIKYEINGNLLLAPDDSKNFLTLSSGGSFFLYGKETALESAAPVTESWFLSAVESLRNARVEFDGSRKVFAEVIVKGSDEAKAMGLGGDDMPWVFAFADPGLSVSVNIEPKYLLARRADFQIPEDLKEKYPDPMNNGKLVLPLAGAHGHMNLSSDLRTSLVMYGPLFSKVAAGQIGMNIDVVPAVADALDVQRPPGCAKK